MAGQDLADALANAGGANVNRPQLSSFVANSQATNGLRSAQTEEALLNAQRAQDEQVAASQLEDAFTQAGARPADAHLMATAAKMHAGSAINAMDMFKAYNATVLGDPSKLGTPDQTAAQQAIQGKVAEPTALPNNFTTLPGAAPVNPQVSAQGAAQLAQTKAVTAEDIARAEEAHARAKNSTSPAGALDPDTVDMAARVVMADPTKMSSYAGFGQSGQANKNSINNRQAALLTQAGMTPEDMIRQRAIAKASVGSTGAAAKQAEVLDAYMPLVKNNSMRIQQLLDQIDAAPGSAPDEPIINGFTRMVGRNLNSDDLAELHSVFGSLQPELARILTAGPNMNGVVSDKSRADVQSMAPESMSSSQARRVLNRLDVELSIRRQGVQAALESGANAQLPVISPHASTLAPPGAAPPAAAAGGGGSKPPEGFTVLN